MSSKSSHMSSELMEALMRDPAKRAMILQLLTQEKDGFEAYKRREQRKSAGTPIRKVQRLHCESPTALQRRRALAQINQETSASSSSDLSDVPTEVKGPKLPFDRLLEGVKAYVEVKRNNVDRSDGIKAVMKLMGATIKDQFSNDVTHVVFKDGSFPTYQKAKLLNVHLVSVLWLDAVRRNNARVLEKNYPAFGSKVPEEEVSILCSQLQKDYEEVIRDEKRRSMSILPESSRKSAEKLRRKTMMTSQSSKSSYLTAQKSSLLFPDEDSRSKSNSPDLTSDDSDCGVIDGEVSKRARDRVDLTQITPDLTGDSESLPNRVTTVNKRRTIHVTTDMVITPNLTERVIQKADKMGNTNKVLQNVSIQSSVMSSLRVSSTSSDHTKSGLVENSKTRDSGNNDNSLTTIGTTMSSLRLSDSLDINEEKQAKNKTKRSKSSSKENSPEFDINVNKRTRVRSVSKAKSAEKKQSETNIRRSRRSVSLLRAESEDETERKTSSGTARDRENRGRSLSVVLLRTDVAKTGNQSDTENSKKVTASRAKPETKKAVSKTKTPKKNKKSFVSKSPDDNQNESSDKTEQASSRSQSEKSSRKTPKSKKLTPSTSSSRTVSGLEDDSRTNCEQSSRSESDHGSDKRTNSAKPGRTPEIRRKDRTQVTEESASTRSESDDRSNRKSRRASSVAPSRSESAVRRVNSRKSITPRRSSTPPATNPSPAKKRRPLFNPDDEINLPPTQDDQEREEYFKRKAKKTPQHVFLNPNDVVITPLPSKKKTKDLSLDDSMEPIDWSSDDNRETEEKRKQQKKKKGNDKTPLRRDSSADEQRDLLELLTKKVDKGVQSRRSERLSLSQIKAKYKISSSVSSESQSTSSLPITPIKRRSTLDFQTVTQTQQKRKLRLDPERPSSVVCTKMHRYEVFEFEKIVRDLGKFFVEYQVTDSTTHLVAGESKRTINMLRALARGCWILKPEWLQKSKEAGKWVSEEDYEDDFSPAVQQCRLQRQAFGPEYSMDIFKECGWIYVAKTTTPKSKDLVELITTCQGKVTSIYRNAEIVVGEFIKGKDVTCVTELWVLDCITYNKLKPVKNYPIKPVGADSPTY